MQIPGLLVEYLINGSTALVWLTPLLLLGGLPINIDHAFTLALFVPILYVLGMIIDSIGRIALNPHKRRIQKSVYEKLNPEKVGKYVKDIELYLNAPELAKANEMRSSRDRIARGAVMNSLLATVSLAFYFQQTEASVSPLSTIVVGLVVTAMCWAMWARHQRASYEFRIQAWRVMKQSSRQHSRPG